ncbi:MAG: adenylate/guanylate cyclase domain-containing protein [Pseudomonadota bacterium]
MVNQTRDTETGLSAAAQQTASRIDGLDNFASGWLSFLTTGTACYKGTQRRRLVMTNVLVFLVAGLMTLYALVFLVIGGLDLILPVTVNIVAALALLLTPKLHPIHPMVGSIYNLTIWLLFATFVSFAFGTASGIHFFFLSGVASAILIMGVRQNAISMLNILTQGGLFMYFDRGEFAPAGFINVNMAQLNVLYYITVPLAVAFIFCMVLYAFTQAHRAETLLQQEYRFSENLLARMLPQSIAEELKQNPGQTIADHHDSATILFADLVGFTPRANRQSAESLVDFLNALFTRFDTLAELNGLEKIKTIGDAFMVAGGMPDKREDHAVKIAKLALEMKAEAKRFASEIDDDCEIRIGIATGPVVAGVIGKQKPFYDVWGGTVNLASRLEASARPGSILISERTKTLIEAEFEVATYGVVELKGVGNTNIYQLVG